MGGEEEEGVEEDPLRASLVGARLRGGAAAAAGRPNVVMTTLPGARWMRTERARRVWWTDAVLATCEAVDARA